MPDCMVCNDLKVLAKPVEWGDGYAAVYPLGTRAKDVIVSCPNCAGESVRQEIAKHSELEEDERVLMLADWKVPSIPDHPGWKAQRRNARTVIEQAITDKAGFYTFWGDFGGGKTMAAQIVLNELRERKAIRGIFSTFAGVLSHLRGIWRRKESTSLYWEKLLDVPVLVLDEITRFDESKAWAQEWLFVLVNTRYRRKDTHLTLFTTNENPNQTLPPEEGIGYLFSRMREGKVVELRGDVRAALGGV
jgi:hypothetical protein